MVAGILAQTVRVFVARSIAMVLLVWSVPCGGQSPQCGAQDLRAVLKSTDKAYWLAMNLAERLRNQNISPKCVLRSTMEGLFEELEGAALYRTDRGDFEALFLPKGLTFDALEVVERSESGRYIYSFSGRPKPWPANRIENIRRMHFIKHANELVIVRDSELAAHLQAALQAR